MSFDVDRQNFENMVHYNSTKLRFIQRGWDPYQVLTLRNDDIILSEEAIELLNEIYKNPL